ncbi:hypothetical protein RclHR1_03320014 [Rhizophagus clarus]|uniref:Uncharacterized protein n=1 Tax=Rhizophagus clarus TaxID=94130 RepID=A0A2Z6S3Y7_9GLOM|nr:hypothetical protein RclHR1_03320014 [Rhizophagus clarus]GET00416.1 hypothetical protein GLOIN_2v1549630 [Rhizophagus clarus]
MNQNDDFQSFQDNNSSSIPSSQTNGFISQENANLRQDVNFSSQYDSTSMGPQQTQINVPTTDSQIQSHPKKFDFRPYDDLVTYHIECESLTGDFILKLLNDQHDQPSYITQFKESKNRFIFFYRQLYDNQIFQITCEILPSPLNNNCLNHFCNIITEQNIKEQLTFAPYQKKYLKHHLESYLGNNLL